MDSATSASVAIDDPASVAGPEPVKEVTSVAKRGATEQTGTRVDLEKTMGDLRTPGKVHWVPWEMPMKRERGSQG